MQAVSSADPALDVSSRARLTMVALGYIPLLHVLVVLAPVVFAATGRAAWRLAWLAPVLLYVLPPLFLRVVTWRYPLPSGRVSPDSGAFLRWWFSAQCQVVFTRLPFLEELLRLVPTLYSFWLRLWGARVGSYVYWSPGVTILDRSMLRVGSRVIFGVGARLNPHVLAPHEGRTVLHLAPISIGDDVLVGGYSVILPGAEIAAGEITPAFRTIHAFSRFVGGRRVAVSSNAAGEVGV